MNRFYNTTELCVHPSVHTLSMCVSILTLSVCKFIMTEKINDFCQISTKLAANKQLYVNKLIINK